MDNELRQGFGKCCRYIYSIFLVCIKSAHKLGIFIILTALSCNLDKVKSFSLSNNGMAVELVQQMQSNYNREKNARKEKDANLRSINEFMLHNYFMATKGGSQNQKMKSSELEKLQNQQKIFDARDEELSRQTNHSIQNLLRVLQKK